MIRGDNVDLVLHVARRLGHLVERVVFLGGAATGLLITDPGAPPPRPTKDVDVVIEVASTVEYMGQLRDELRSLGFNEDTEEGAPLCRWIIEDVKVDVMPTSGDVLGFTNRWYGAALAHAVRFEVATGLAVRLVTAPYFLATNLEAFSGRGADDFAASHDLEDFLAVVDGRPGIEGEVARADAEVRCYLAQKIGELLEDTRFLDALPGHLPGDIASQARLPSLTDRLRRLATMV
ncbi:MAG: hypothetical protein V2A73_06980 [Pseudomonadota bacterium]